MENYGCEYLDLEEYKEPTFRSNWIWLPISLVEKTADSKYITEISIKSTDYISNLMQDISKRGLKEPGKLVISKNRVKLQNGNHRLVATTNLGYTRFPVITEYSDGTMTQGYLLQDFIKEFLA